MLVRHMFGYAPSLVVTAVLSLAALSFFTHWMLPAEYGEYALMIATMTMLIGVCFSWLQNTSSRLLPQAAQQGNETEFTATLYGIFAICGVVLLAVAAALACSMPLGNWQVAVWFAPPLAILRGLLNLNQAGHRNFLRIGHYNIIEIGQAVISLGATVALVMLLPYDAAGASTGMAFGLLAMSLFDWRALSRIEWRKFDRQMLGEIFSYGWPFIANSGFGFVLASSDRMVIEHFMGPSAVGVYAAGYAFPDRIGQYLFMAVATASFPLLVRRMEQEGVEAAREQTYTNGVAMLALAVPACIGLLLVNRQIASVMIGGDFRADAIEIMPWITIAMIMNGLAAHYFDHAFHLAKKTRLFFLTLGPAAALNLGINWFYAVPKFGIMGAAYTTMAAYALYMALSIIIGRRVFRIKFPFKPALQVSVSTAAMALVLMYCHFPADWGGLIAAILVGGFVYGAGALLFNILDCRTYLENLLQKKRGRARLKSTGLSFDVLRTAAQIAACAPEWQALYVRAGRPLFGSHVWFDIWWRHLGLSGSYKPYLVTARDNGRLVAVLPLAVRRSGLLSVLEWGGYDVFDFGDALAETALQAEAVWHFARTAAGYDIALIKDVHATAHSLAPLQVTATARDPRRNYFLALDFPSGEAWLAAQSRKLRGDIRRKREKMQAGGEVVFRTYRNDAVPANVIDALYAQKSSWFIQRKEGGVFSRPQVKSFLSELAADAAAEGRLYLATLSCGDAIVACHMGFIRDGVLHLYHTTYDAAFGSHSPGNIIMVDTIIWAIDHNLRELDFMRGDETYKQRFASGDRGLASFIHARTLVGRLALRWRSRPQSKSPVVVKSETQEDQ